MRGKANILARLILHRKRPPERGAFSIRIPGIIDKDKYSVLFLFVRQAIAERIQALLAVTIVDWNL